MTNAGSPLIEIAVLEGVKHGEDRRLMAFRNGESERTNNEEKLISNATISRVSVVTVFIVYILRLI